jgi:hypothetical protein
LAHLGNGESAGRMFRGIKAKINERDVDGAVSSNPGTPSKNKSVHGDVDAAAAADPDSPSLIASDKKKQKKATTTGGGSCGGGKFTLAGRKRTQKEAALEDDDGDQGSGYDGDKNESEGGERPKKIPKHTLGKTVVTFTKVENAQSGADDSI